MIKIAITGPESSGKSTLASWLHNALPQSVLVHEFARSFLEEKEKHYSYIREDLIEINRGHFLQLREAEKMDFFEALITDTDFYVMDIWWNEIYGDHHEEIYNIRKLYHFDLYLLCEPDLPWVFDPLRENPADRYRLFERYKEALTEDKRKYEIIRGEGEVRNEQALAAVRKHFPSLQ